MNTKERRIRGGTGVFCRLDWNELYYAPFPCKARMAAIDACRSSNA